MYMSDDEVLITILLIYMAILGAVLLVYLVGYILQGIGMYTMGKRKGKENCWLAFVPYARVYFQGELAGPIQLKNKQIKNPGIWILLIPIISGVIASLVWGIMWSGMMSQLFSTIGEYGMYGMEPGMNYMFGGGGAVVFIVGMIVYIIVMIFVGAVNNTLLVLVNRQIYKECTPDGMAIAHAVLGIFIPLYTPICFFVLRRRVPLVVPPMNYGPYPQGPMNDPMHGPENPPIQG